jgi:hypothetical protein
LLLKHSPEQQGESRSKNERILILAPLVILFEIHPEDLRVDIFGDPPFARKVNDSAL